MDYLAGEIHTDDLLLWESLPSITGATVSTCMSTMRRQGREFLSTDPPVTFSMKDSTLLTTQPTDLSTQQRKGEERISPSLEIIYNNQENLTKTLRQD